VKLAVGLGLKLGLAVKLGERVGVLVTVGVFEKDGVLVKDGVMENVGLVVAVPTGPLKRLCSEDLGSWGLLRVGLSSQSGKARRAAADKTKSSPKTGMDALFFMTLPAGG
jgi:hypothetical protein